MRMRSACLTAAVLALTTLLPQWTPGAAAAPAAARFQSDWSTAGCDEPEDYPRGPGGIPLIVPVVGWPSPSPDEPACAATASASRRTGRLRLDMWAHAAANGAIPGNDHPVGVAELRANRTVARAAKRVPVRVSMSIDEASVGHTGAVALALAGRSMLWNEAYVELEIRARVHGCIRCEGSTKRRVVDLSRNLRSASGALDIVLSITNLDGVVPAAPVTVTVRVVGSAPLGHIVGSQQELPDNGRVHALFDARVTSVTAG